MFESAEIRPSEGLSNSFDRHAANPANLICVGGIRFQHCSDADLYGSGSFGNRLISDRGRLPLLKLIAPLQALAVRIISEACRPW